MPAIPSTYLGFLLNLSKFLMSLAGWKPQPPKSKRTLKLERARKVLVEKRKAMRLEEERTRKAIAAKKREEQRKRDRELRKAKYKKAQMNSRQMSDVWDKLARDQNFVTVLGIFFFYIFYRTLVLSYRKNQKDYEDRLKIEKAEVEERRKIKQLERELAGMGSYPKEDENEESGKEKEKDPYRAIMKFMKSGGHVVC